MSDRTSAASALVEKLFDRPATGPLAGLVVADLSRVLAGPYCTMLLADMGALVVKVESRLGDDTRTWAPPHRDGEATYYLSVNRNKYSIALDFTDPDELAIVQQIVARADVLVENFKAGSLRKYGLDYDSVRTRRPDLVYASITGFGTKAGVDLPGYDLIAQAVSGMMDLTGRSEDEPTKLGVALFDVVTGLNASVGILAALRQRDRTGLGEHVEVNLLSSALSGLVNQTGAAVASGTIPTRMGNAHPSLYPYEPFPTRDKDLVIAAGNDSQFARLCEVLGMPGLAVDDRFATMPARNGHRDELRGLLVHQLRTRDAADWFQRLRDAGVPSAPILTVAEGIRFADDLGLSPVVESGKDDRRIPTVRNPIGFASTDLDYSQAPPRLDADRDRIRRWLDATGDPAVDETS